MQLGYNSLGEREDALRQSVDRGLLSQEEIKWRNEDNNVKMKSLKPWLTEVSQEMKQKNNDAKENVREFLHV